jgi:putative transposase
LKNRATGRIGQVPLAAETFQALRLPSAETFLGVSVVLLAKEGLMSFSSFRLATQSFLHHDGLPFADLLPEETVRQIARDAGLSPIVSPHGDESDHGVVYTTPVTLWAFLSQVLFRGEHRSCRAAVARVVVLCVALGRPPCSDNTGAYCRARARLPLALIRRLAEHVAETAEANVPKAWLWKGRHVDLVDGTTVSAPDTASLQARYPQPKVQKPGLGFPLIRLVVLMSLATAMVNGMAMGPYAGKETGETALLRQLFERLKPGGVVLADRYYCSYFMIAMMRAMGVDVVTRQHQGRTSDFRRGRRLGSGDHIVVWLRPPRPTWMDRETYEQIPESMEIREVHVQVHQPGFRVEALVVVTTLTDAEAYPRVDIAELYHRRWLVELDIRSLKITLGMDVLRCKTPALVEKEIWTCLLAYNLIRQSMLQAAILNDLSPRQLSFTAALQKTAASWGTLLMCDEDRARTLIETHLRHMATQLVGDRPNRVEPRAIKRRPKPHKLLTKPRAQAQAALLSGASVA